MKLFSCVWFPSSITGGIVVGVNDRPENQNGGIKHTRVLVYSKALECRKRRRERWICHRQMHQHRLKAHSEGWASRETYRSRKQILEQSESTKMPSRSPERRSKLSEEVQNAEKIERNQYSLACVFYARWFSLFLLPFSFFLSFFSFLLPLRIFVLFFLYKYK